MDEQAKRRIMTQLTVLCEDSGKRLPEKIIMGFDQMAGGLHLITRTSLQSDWVPRGGTASLLKNLHSAKKVWAFGSANGVHRNLLNHTLKGDSFPILDAALVMAIGGVGLLSGGGAMIIGGCLIAFNGAKGLIKTETRDTDVLARVGDEILQIEEIGKQREDHWFSSDGYVATHVVSYFLIDPYRSGGHHRCGVGGWLLHEQRRPIALG